MNLNDIIFEIPFIDIIPKDTYSINKIKLGHQLNPCASVILDGLNIGDNKYDSSYIITCDKYKKNGHSNNFASDFKQRYNIEPTIINIDNTNIDDILNTIHNNSNIFLKLDLCDNQIYDILKLLDSKKFVQIVCTELPIPKTIEHINVFLKYNGVETTQELLNELNISNNLTKISSNHYLFSLTPRWSINDNWEYNTPTISPPLQMCTFLKQEFYKYIKLIDVGNSDVPQKEIELDMTNVSNILFQNEFDIYPDKFSCFTKENSNLNRIIISRIDKTRMGWGQNLKAITNVIMFPKISNCVFVRKDIMNETRFVSLQKTNPNFINGYKNIILKTSKDTTNSNHEIKNKPIGIILSDNKNTLDFLKKTFNSVNVKQTIDKTLKTIYYSLNNKNKKYIKNQIIQLLFNNLVGQIKSDTLITYSGYDYKNKNNKLLKDNEIINVKQIINGNYKYIFTDVMINQNDKQQINNQEIDYIRTIINDYNSSYVIKKYTDYRIITDIIELCKEII